MSCHHLLDQCSLHSDEDYSIDIIYIKQRFRLNFFSTSVHQTNETAPLPISNTVMNAHISLF